MHDVTNWVILRLAGPPALKTSQAAVSQVSGISVTLLFKCHCELLLHCGDRVLRLNRTNLDFEFTSFTVALLADSILYIMRRKVIESKGIKAEELSVFEAT